jgi:hypothetical protein
MEKISSIWKSAPSDIQPPTIQILYFQGQKYAVVEDDSSIIIVASKDMRILAAAKNKTNVELENGTPYYVVDEKMYSPVIISPLKVISCSGNTIKNKNQKFVIKNIVAYL